MSSEDHQQDWNTRDYVVIDVEGTGSSATQRIIEIAAVKILDGEIQAKMFHHLLNPGIEVSAFATRIHGIRSSDLVGMPAPEEIEEDFEEFCLGAILVAHNAHVEIKLLKNTFSKFPFSLSLDTLKLSKKLYPERRSHSLDILVKEMALKVPHWYSASIQRHRAQYDALMAALAFKAMVTECRDDSLPFAELVSLASTSISDLVDQPSDSGSPQQMDLF